MSSSGPARGAGPSSLTALLALGVALLGVAGYKSLAASSSPTTSPAAAEQFRGVPSEGLPGDLPRQPGAADGVVPEGVTVFDDQYPAVAKLDPALLRALQQAAAGAADDGIRFYVDSGWRSREYQEQLLEEAVLKYGSEAEAARWVATPETSAHVSGDAVDVGPSDATAWLSRHGAGYGLCRIYRNEPWHFELRPKAVIQGCPAMYADPSQDPRMQR